MATLATPLRKELEKAVRAAREVAERGARETLDSLAVARAEHHSGMTPEQRALRNLLRAHGRQLGDAREPDGAQAVRRLVTPVRYCRTAH